MVEPIRVFDLHCDTLSESEKRGIGLDSPLMPHFSLGRIPADICWTQCVAMFMPDELRGAVAVEYCRKLIQRYRLELAAHLQEITAVTDLTQLRETQTRLTTVLTVEGGSALGGELSHLAWLYGEGVRMMTLTWNGANEIAGGAATDQGFTHFGRQVIAEMERLGMLADVSHLSDRAFWELCELAGRPFAASHSNARAVCDHRRNLSDEMFREIMRRGGVVGLNYYDHFIREGGGSRKIEDLMRHVYHLLELGGEDTLALGSDYDGADLPPYLDGVDKFPNLLEALAKSGISAAVVDKILYGNAARFFSPPQEAFPFAEGLQTPVAVCRHLLEGAPLFRVYHLPEESPHWHVVCEQPEHGDEERAISTLGEICRLFPEIGELADIPSEMQVMMQRGKISGKWIDFHY